MSLYPIKSKEDADKVFNFLVNTTMLTLGVEKKQAEKRIRALLDSGLLKGGSPDNPETQRIIDKFMTTHID